MQKFHHYLFPVLIYILSLLPGTLHSQSAFVQLPDATGYAQDTTHFVYDSLKSASTALQSTLPSAYQADFAVYDLGFYSHHTSMDGGIPQVISDAIDNHITTPYYLLFGREMDDQGDLKQVWVEVELPESNCLDQITPIYIDGIVFLMELEFSGNNSMNNIVPGYKYFMSELIKLIDRKMNCCQEALGGGSSRQFTPIDINCDICLGNTFVQDSFEIITVSKEPGMPVVGIQCFTEISELCMNLSAELTIYFARNCIVDANGNPDRHRRDTIVRTIEDFHLFNYFMFEFGTETHWGNEWDVIQGGKAEIRVFDDSDNLVFFYPFSIVGTNPSIVTVLQHLDKDPYNELWFFKKLALHESASNKAPGIEMRQFNPYSSNFEDVNGDLEWEAWSRTPNRGPPCGWGITQLDNEKPHPIGMWNWKANIHEAYHRLVGEYLSNARGHLRPLIYQAWNWDDDESNQSNLTVTPNDTIIGDVTWVWKGSEYFTDNFLISNNHGAIDKYNEYFPNLVTGDKRSFLDGEILRRYNGLGSPIKRFLELVDVVNEEDIKIGQNWKINHAVTNGTDENLYIISISNENVPNH
ncbi:MAG: hypothetical protein EA411_09090 [Saprospirales bacterium]|nr:MAG: hypothetical protein EA411_09090 [Saprospirales bacterium]